MLNRIALSGGTYKDWIDTVYTSGFELHAETPIYCGGSSAEIIFNEVVATGGNEVLGTLAGKPTLILEKEEDTFGSDVLINIDTLPLGLDESLMTIKYLIAFN